jgi:hypothetical protein
VILIYNYYISSEGRYFQVKEATGELNMTIIVVIAVAAIGIFLWAFLPGILNSVTSTGTETCTPSQVKAGTCTDK